MYPISCHFKDHSEMSEKIHSGQFMISKYDEESDSEDTNHKEKGYNFDSNYLSKNFHFMERGQNEHKLEIDDSLNTMFQYLSIAMSGKITNPKWNSFKGVKFQSKDKIRLNNIIWREYHMQFVKKLKPVVVQFASPLSDSLQINGNVVLEGKYWKRQEGIILYQYKKWRMFSKNRAAYHLDDSKQTGLFESILVQRSGLHHKFHGNSQLPNLNDIFMDLDDLNLPIDDISGVQHNSQIIQPQLTNLQPRMESSIGFINDYFCATHKTMKSHKLFSSETSINVKPREISDIKNTYFQCPVATYSDNRTESSSTYLSSGTDFSKPHRRKSNMKPSNQYQQKSYQSRSNNSSSELGICKTPNLLSILLQPMTSGSSHIPQTQTCPDDNSIPVVPNKQSLVITSTKCTNNHHPGSSMSSNTYDTTHNQDLNTYQQPGINYLNHTPIISSYTTSAPSSEFNHSSTVRHSLNTANIVQQYLDELSGLLMSNRDQNKISKAALLHKASEHIKRLRIEKQRLQSEIVTLQSEIDNLQNRFSAFCSQLPATGVRLSNNKSEKGTQWFDDFVTKHSITNWKFYIFCMMFESLFTGYNNSVSTMSMETLAHSVASWLEKECSLMKLRLIVINGMRTLSRRTSIVHTPRQLEDEVKTLIQTSNTAQATDNARVWSSHYHNEALPVSRRSDQSISVRHKSATNSSWPQLSITDVHSIRSSEGQDK